MSTAKILPISDASLIFSVLKQYGRSGCGVISLARDTGIDAHSLRGYLTKNPDYFSKVGTSRKYTLNRFGTFKGCEKKMLHNLEKRHKTRIRQQSMSTHSLLNIVLP